MARLTNKKLAKKAAKSARAKKGKAAIISPRSRAFAKMAKKAESR